MSFTTRMFKRILSLLAGVILSFNLHAEVLSFTSNDIDDMNLRWAGGYDERYAEIRQYFDSSLGDLLSVELTFNEAFIENNLHFAFDNYGNSDSIAGGTVRSTAALWVDVQLNGTSVLDDPSQPLVEHTFEATCDAANPDNNTTVELGSDYTECRYNWTDGATIELGDLTLRTDANLDLWVDQGYQAGSFPGYVFGQISEVQQEILLFEGSRNWPGVQDVGGSFGYSDLTITYFYEVPSPGTRWSFLIAAISIIFFRLQGNRRGPSQLSGSD